LLIATADGILKWEAGQKSVYRRGLARGITFDHQGRLLACEADRVVRVEKDGAVTVLAGPVTQPQDLVYAIDGSVYFTAGRVVHHVTRERAGVGGKGSLGRVRIATSESKDARGVALGPNQQRLYVSGSGRIRVYDIGPDGSLLRGRDFASVEAAGLKTDEAGNVWAAASAGVAVLDPAGRLSSAIRTPAPAVALNWGSGFRGLYIATATAVLHAPARSPGTRTY
jgi:gluconolactonase